jgi:hypothetical protein
MANRREAIELIILVFPRPRVRIYFTFLLCLGQRDGIFLIDITINNSNQLFYGGYSRSNR